MKKLILTLTTLVMLSSSALAFQGVSEPPDSPQSQFTILPTKNSLDKMDDPNAHTGNDHEVHIEEDIKTEENNSEGVRRRAPHNRLPK